ncbi:hypothetical protein BJ741DRAFT_541720 [Chytriomyces cf. hyalinus JEL632]|nr:hypothetical protein BJ741DRAFT_541720 [Chytriomyces cf. hyalinus JEL632]
MYKALISHCQTLLTRHQALSNPPAKQQRGAVSRPHPTSKGGHVAKEASHNDTFDLSEPVAIVDEKELLQLYWKENNITLESDKVFLEETLLGCVRNERIIDKTLSLFYKVTGGRYLGCEYNLFSVLTYLCLFRLKTDLSFPILSKCVKSFNPTKMARFLAFLFDTAHLLDDGILMNAWAEILDRAHIKNAILVPLLQHADAAKDLIEELLIKSEKGMVPKKSTKPNTEPAPFILTVQNPRKIPEPPFVYSTVTKAKKIPKAVYTTSGEMDALKEIKAENRRKAEEEYQKAQKRQFELTKRASKAPPLPTKKEIISAMSNTATKPTKAKPVPSSLFSHVPVKTTVAAILREDALVRKNKLEEEKMLAESELTLRDTNEFEMWQEDIKAKETEERQIELEKLRLKVQLVHEDSFLARQEKQQENKGIVIEMKQEKQVFRHLSEQAQRELDFENKRKIEDVHEIMESVVRAKEKVVLVKQKRAADVVNETQFLMEMAQREAAEELSRKMELIQQIRLLEKAIPPVGGYIKALDLTETSNLGLLGEMSIIEASLHERLAHMRVRESELAQERRQDIIKEKETRLAQVSEKLEDIDRERQERRRKRLEASYGPIGFSRTTSSASFSEEHLSIHSLERKSMDPALREMQEKLLAKKALRMNAKSKLSALKSSGVASSILKNVNQNLESINMDASAKPQTGSSASFIAGIPVLRNPQLVSKSQKDESPKAEDAAINLINPRDAEHTAHMAQIRKQLEDQKLKLLADISAAHAKDISITLAVPQGTFEAIGVTVEKTVKFASSIETL